MINLEPPFRNTAQNLRSTHPPQNPARIALAAREFEALLLTQLLRTAREATSEVGPDPSGDASGGIALEMAETQLAQALSVSGGLGLASMVVTGLGLKTDQVSD